MFKHPLGAMLGFGAHDDVDQYGVMDIEGLDPEDAAAIIEAMGAEGQGPGGAHEKFVDADFFARFDDDFDEDDDGVAPPTTIAAGAPGTAAAAAAGANANSNSGGK